MIARCRGFRRPLRCFCLVVLSVASLLVLFLWLDSYRIRPDRREKALRWINMGSYFEGDIDCVGAGWSDHLPPDPSCHVSTSCGILTMGCGLGQQPPPGSVRRFDFIGIRVAHGRWSEAPYPWADASIPREAGITYAVIPFWLLFVMAAAWPTGVLTIGAIIRRRRRARGACLNCGYNLTGNASGLCPECGVVSRVQSTISNFQFDNNAE